MLVAKDTSKIEIGKIYIHHPDNERFMLIGRTNGTGSKMGIINLTTGEMWRDFCEVKDLNNISPDEFKMITYNWTGSFTREHKTPEYLDFNEGRHFISCEDKREYVLTKFSSGDRLIYKTWILIDVLTAKVWNDNAWMSKDHIMHQDTFDRWTKEVKFQLKD